MLPALAGLAGVVVTAAVAIFLREREARQRRAEREESDVWRAIDSLRKAVGELSAQVAEFKGLLTGLFREVLDDPEVWRPPRVRTRDRERGE